MKGKERSSSLFIALYRVPEARTPLNSDEFRHPFPYCLVRDGDVRGLCACYYTREDVTAKVLDERLQLHQVEERCGREGGREGGKGVAAQGGREVCQGDGIGSN